MAWVISVGGQKGGSGKSTIAQGLAVEGVRHGALVILADMDLAQQTSLRWGERRKALGIEPKIDVRLLRAVAGIPPLRRLCDLLVVDTPGRADVNTLNLARASDLLVLSSDTNVFELEPTVMLLHELKAAGIDQTRLAVALCKVLDDKREAEARAYLKSVGYEALSVALKFHALTHDIGNEGKAVTEARQKNVAEPAEKFFSAIVSALDRARQQEQQANAVKERDKAQERGRER
jgi:chromosome partitioning protein